MHIANDVFGQLQKSGTILSGYYDDTLFEAASEPPTWTISVLERLDVDHADGQEVMALSNIHVQEVYATSAPPPLLSMHSMRTMARGADSPLNCNCHIV